MQRKLVSVSAILFAVLLSVQTMAQTVPYRASGQNASYFPVPTGSGAPELYRGAGVGTHVGRHTFAGQIFTEGEFYAPGALYDPEADLYVFFAGEFEGSQVLKAANGDTIDYAVSGPVKLYWYDPASFIVIGRWNVDFEITGGTGRFANVSGSVEGVAINPPFNPNTPEWKFNWEIAGSINLGKRKSK